MFNVEEIKKKRQEYERKIEELMKEFEKEISPLFKIESVVVIRDSSSEQLKGHIKLEVANVNK